MTNTEKMRAHLIKIGVLPKNDTPQKEYFYDPDLDVDQEVKAGFTPFGIGYNYFEDWAIREHDWTISAVLKTAERAG